MSENVERVAKAIYMEYQRVSIERMGWGPGWSPSWDKAGQLVKSRYLRMAGAAIAATTLIDSERPSYLKNREDA